MPQYVPFVNEPGSSTDVPAQIHSAADRRQSSRLHVQPDELQRTAGRHRHAHRLRSRRPRTGPSRTTPTTQPTARRCRSNRASPSNWKPTSAASTAPGWYIKVKATKGDANIHQTKLVFPATCPSRLTTIQKACRRPHLQREPGELLAGRLRDRNRDREHAGAEIAAGRARLPRLARERVFPDAEFVLQGEGVGCCSTVRPSSRRPAQQRRHQLDLRIRSRRAGRNVRSQPSAWAALGLQRLRQPVRRETDDADLLPGQNGAKMTSTTKIKLLWLRRGPPPQGNRSADRPEEVQENLEQEQAGKLRKGCPPQVRADRMPQAESQEEARRLRNSRPQEVRGEAKKKK